MKLILQALISIIFGVISYLLASILYANNVFNIRTYSPSYSTIIVAVIFGIIFYFIISSFLAKLILNIMSQIEEIFVKMNLRELAISTVGILVGLVTANLIGLAIARYGVLGTVIVMLLNVVLGFIGFQVAQKKKDEVSAINLNGRQVSKNEVFGKPKILDTSVIIDNRILGVLKTGFIEGKIVIPSFVLDELRHIADSADSLKRNRGRHGLDILNEIQKLQSISVETVDWDAKDSAEVDVKLIKLAKKLNAYVVTNDFNLNKVADFRGVSVLNVNELANAVKPAALPGEDMTVAVIKEGKEDGQGIGYLNDGTMIVVEGGHQFIGETIEVSVTSALQTAAGRMIFTKKKE